MFRRIALCLLPVILVSSAFAQLITTEVGADWLLSTGGVSAIATPLGQLFGVATDAKGNIYFADYDNHKVMSLQANGVLTVIAGNGYPSFSGDGGPAVDASLQFPQGVAVGPDGTVYIADTGNDRIRKVTPAGVITTYAGNGSESFSGDGGIASAASLFAPNSVAVDSAGNLFIADTRHNRIRKVATTGIITTVAGNGLASYAGDNVSATATSLNEPFGIAVDSAGNLYIADTFNNRIRKVVVGGTITTLAGTGVPGYADGAAASAQVSYPKQLVADSKGNVFVADPGNNLIREITGATMSTVAGNLSRAFSGDGGPARSASLGNPSSVATDAAGNIYIADTQNGRIRMVNATNGTIRTIAGSGGFRNSPNGALAPDAFLNNPQDVKIGPNGLLYIVDSQNERILRVNADNTTTTVAGNHQYGFSGDGGVATSATLYDPRQMAFDSMGNFYIADSQNVRIRKVSTAGIISTFAGNGSAGYSGDGGVATSAALNYPTGVACDSAGNVYIADQLNNVVRKVAPTGAISTFAGTGNAGYNGDEIPATQAALFEPERLFVDSTNRLFIADIYNHRVRMVTNDGIIHTVAGTGVAGYAGDGGPATQAELNSPAGIAVDSQGNVYIADTGNGVIRVVNSSGAISTMAGTGQAGFSGDGGLATQATLNGPRSMVPDNGALHIADTNNNRVRKVFQPSASITSEATPKALTFSALSGAGPGAAQTVALSAAISGLGFSVSAGSPWISVTPSSGFVPALIQVTADATRLSAGTYQGNVIVTVPDATPPTATVSVTFQVGAVAAPKLGTSAPSVTITAPQGSAPVMQSLQILNTGGGSLPFTATITSSGGSWLSVSPLSGTATPSVPASLTVAATPGKLPAGTYSGAITITAAGSTSTVPVTLSISAPSGTLLISQSALTFNAVSQGGVTLPQAFSVLNVGSGSLDWRASASTLSGGNWLQVSPSSGTVQQPLLSYSTVSATVNPASLTPGAYYGTVQIQSSGAVNSPQIVTVILNVLPAGTNLGPQVYPNGLIFTGIAGSSPGSQPIMVGNTGTSPNSYVSGVIGPIALLPSNATIQPSQPATLVVQPDFTNLGPGISRGTITLQFSDGSASQAVNVLLSVSPGSVTQDSSAASDGEEKLKFGPRATSCPPAALQVIFRLPQPFPNFNVAVGQSMSIEAAISDACGNLVAPGSQQPQIVVNFGNGDPQQTMSYLGNGVWQTAWRPVTAAPSVTVAITALILSGSTIVGGQAKVSGAVLPHAAAGSTPIVTAQGVVHAASDVGAIPIAPGELVTVYGANLASQTVGNSGLPLPLSSAATQVFLGAQPLPLLYTSSGQINVQVPYSVPVNTTFQLLVQNGTTISVPQALSVAQASPGIFTINEQGFGQGAVLKSDGVTLAQPGSPAAIGEIVTIYCTGLGATTPPATQGEAAPSSPLAQTENTTTVMIGGQPAHVQYSGLTPAFAGLYQVNAIVPSGIPTGDTVPVIITVAGQTSQAGVTMSVH